VTLTVRTQAPVDSWVEGWQLLSSSVRSSQRNEDKWVSVSKLTTLLENVASSPPKEEDEMRSQLTPLRNRSAKTIPRKEVLGAVDSALGLTNSMAVALII
jgi:hypothetical protein